MAGMITIGAVRLRLITNHYTVDHFHNRIDDLLVEKENLSCSNWLEGHTQEFESVIEVSR